jgi:hypothetical protein
VPKQNAQFSRDEALQAERRKQVDRSTWNDLYSTLLGVGVVYSRKCNSGCNVRSEFFRDDAVVSDLSLKVQYFNANDTMKQCLLLGTLYTLRAATTTAPFLIAFIRFTAAHTTGFLFLFPHTIRP